MKRLFTLSCFILLLQTAARAQQADAGYDCARTKMSLLKNTARVTVLDALEEQYDINYVFLDLKMSNQDAGVSGSATTKAKVTAASMSKYCFELDASMVIDSLQFNLQTLPVVSTGTLRTVNLPSALSQGNSFTVKVFYHGTGTTGIYSQSNVTYTYSTPYIANGWWPCKQSLQDKIDSLDVWLTVPTGQKAGSNGILTNILPAGPGFSCYQWKNRNPISYYLISASVSNFVEHSYYMHFTNSSDSMLVQSYMLPSSTAGDFANVDSVGQMINYFSSLFGRYPFWKEKYGHCYNPINGGMEHQTMISTNTWETWLLAHELCHQWFGDNVTCATWQDVWLNEGFATYGDYLFRKEFWGANAATKKMKDIHNIALNSNGGSVYFSDTANVFATNTQLYYEKGASGIHTLRFLINNDSLFFAVLKSYQQQYAGKNATTEQFKVLASQLTNQNLDTFFSQWIYGQGYPTYNVKYNQLGDDVYVQLNQTTSKPASVSFFTSPIELKLISASSDTTIRVYHTQNGEIFHFKWNQSLQTVGIDPNDWLLKKLGPIVKQSNLAVADLNAAAMTITPNPTEGEWRVNNLKANSQLVLTNITGQQVWSKEAGNQQEMIIPASGLPAGIYMLRITTAGKEMQVVKLVKE